MRESLTLDPRLLTLKVWSKDALIAFFKIYKMSPKDSEILENLRATAE